MLIFHNVLLQLESSQKEYLRKALFYLNTKVYQSYNHRFLNYILSQYIFIYNSFAVLNRKIIANHITFAIIYYMYFILNIQKTTNSTCFYYQVHIELFLDVISLVLEIGVYIVVSKRMIKEK